MSSIKILSLVLLIILLIPASLIVTIAALWLNHLDDDAPDESDLGDNRVLYRGNRPLKRDCWRHNFDDGYDNFRD